MSTSEKRYTIHLAIFEIDAEGDFVGDEQSGVTLDFATTDFDGLDNLMSDLYGRGESMLSSYVKPPSTITVRRPEDAEGDEGDGSGKGYGSVTPASNVRHPEITVLLTGLNGNALVLIGAVATALRNADIPEVELDEFRQDALSGDYNHVIQTCMAWVNVI